MTDFFQDECGCFDYVHDIAQKIITIDDIDFIGMNWVVDYPFRLKDRCRMDHEDHCFQMQYGTALLSTEDGWNEIADWPGYVKQLPTIKDELERLPETRERTDRLYNTYASFRTWSGCLSGWGEPLDQTLYMISSRTSNHYFHCMAIYMNRLM